MNPVAYGTQWNRIGLEVKFVYLYLRTKSVLWTYMGIVQFLINHTLSHFLSRLAGASLSACQGVCKGSSAIMHV